MLVSRLQGIASALDLEATQASSPSSAAAKCNEDTLVAIVDLKLPSLAIDDLRAQLIQAHDAVRIVASGPHVHTKLLAAAEAAGCDLVVSRGQLDREGAALISQLLGD